MAKPKKTSSEIVSELMNEPENIKPKYIPIRFSWVEFRPDKRQYNQQTLLLEPYQTWVTVQVPNDPKYFVYQDEFAKVQQDLTPAGLRYCVDQLDALFVDTAPEESDADEPDWDTEKGEDTNTKDTWDTDEVDTDTDETDTDWEDKDKEEDDPPWNTSTEQEFNWEE